MRELAGSYLNENAFLDAVKRRTDRGHDMGKAVAWVLERHQLAPALAARLLQRGAADFASDVLIRAPRDWILRSVQILRDEAVEDSRVVQVIRSELRDWPIFTGDGYKILDLCTVEEGEKEVMQLVNTITGLENRLQVIASAVKAARDRGLSIIGELSDEVLDACLTERK